MKKLLIQAATILGSFAPLAALAAGPTQGGAVSSGATLQNVLGQFGVLIQQATPIVVALALLGFFWGLAKLLFSKGDEQKKEGRTIMVWGILALFVMITIFGIISVLATTFGVNGGTVFVPQITQ